MDHLTFGVSRGQVNNSVTYRSCPSVLYSNLADKMAYAISADPDQVAPEGAV